ncbi:hypothetical protein [Solidesulfovibrio sp.]
MSISSKIRNVRNALEGMAKGLTEQQQATLRMAQGELTDAADWAEELEHTPLCDLGVAAGASKEERL